MMYKKTRYGSVRMRRICLHLTTKSGRLGLKCAAKTHAPQKKALSRVHLACSLALSMKQVRDVIVVVQDTIWIASFSQSCANNCGAYIVTPWESALVPKSAQPTATRCLNLLCPAEDSRHLPTPFASWPMKNFELLHEVEDPF